MKTNIRCGLPSENTSKIINLSSNKLHLRVCGKKREHIPTFSNSKIRFVSSITLVARGENRLG